MKRKNEGRDWAIILAGGEGRRLADLTRALYGEDRPKQFAVIAGERSLLQQTVERVAPLVPFERMVVVVTEPHESLARSQLAAYGGIVLAVQPENRDTGPGVVIGLALVRARDPGARVTVFPADHHVRDAGQFLDAVSAARAACCSGIALVGARPEGPETEYGWILAGHRGVTAGRAIRPVDRFVEKPGPDVAARLFTSGGLWNTFVFAARVTELWGIADRYLSEQTRTLGEYASVADSEIGPRVLASVYARIRSANFSRAVLSKASGMVVTEAVNTGWSDWGTSRRVFASLEGRPEHRLLVARVAAHSDGHPASSK